MKVTEEGTTNIIKWYQPESAEECKSTDCMKCVYYSYVPSSSSCPFEAWMINHPRDKATDPDKPVSEHPDNVLFEQRLRDSISNLIKQKPSRKVRCIPEDPDKTSNAVQDQRSAQDILTMCSQMQANTMKAQLEPLTDMVNVLDLIIEVTEKQDKITKIQQEQPAQEDQSNIPLWFLPSMENANDDVDGRDHYHHCPQKDNKLVRLIYVEEDKVHACPTCRRVFYLK